MCALCNRQIYVCNEPANNLGVDCAVIIAAIITDRPEVTITIGSKHIAVTVPITSSQLNVII